MLSKVFVGLVAAAGVGIAGVSYTAPKGGCCTPGAACCYEGSPCCDTGVCCVPGAACCEAADGYEPLPAKPACCAVGGECNN